ncbi:MAG: GIY-YIG nuclease family protein [Candidatus Omnitrophota bacterium]|jgi:putative endonuclease
MRQQLFKPIVAQKSCVAEFTPTPIILGMFYMYILKSEKDQDLYIGFTKDLKRRIEEHNNGLVASTKSRKPLELVYYEGYKSEKETRKREENLKLRSRAFTQLKNRIGESLK